VKTVRIGHTPDADDAFMFYGLNSGRCSASVALEHVLEPMQQLNRRALEAELEMTAMSFATYFQVAQHYRPIASGLSLGHGYGPLIVSHPDAPQDWVRSQPMGTPGELTSAHWLARLWNPGQTFVPVRFDETLQAVLEGHVASALVIHEGQMTYRDAGLELVADLGQWWAAETGGLPVPLGLNAVRRDLPAELQQQLAQALHDSIALALNDVENALDAALPLARGLDRDRCREFVLRYVNATTLDPGLSGYEAVRQFYGRAAVTPPPLDWLQPA
jgi:1,4-dihydroxy-6-naphthoate synthase